MTDARGGDEVGSARHKPVRCGGAAGRGALNYSNWRTENDPVTSRFAFKLVEEHSERRPPEADVFNLDGGNLRRGSFADFRLVVYAKNRHILRHVHSRGCTEVDDIARGAVVAAENSRGFGKGADEFGRFAFVDIG